MGYEVVVLASHDYTSSLLKKEGCHIINFEIYPTSINIFKNFFILYKYYYFFKKNNFDLVLTYTIKPNLVLGIITRLFNVKHIVTISGLGNSYLNRFLFFFVKILYRICIYNKHHIFFHNQEDLSIFNKKIFHSNNISVVNGSGINYSNLNKTNFVSRKSKNLKFLYAGRLIKNKGIFDLLEAIQLLKKNYPNITFTLIGYSNNLEKKINKKLLYLKNKKIINLLDFQNNIKNYIEDSDCIIFPSYREGLSKFLLETCLTGRPIITNDVAGCRNLVIDKYNGFLTEPRSYKSIIDAVNKFIKLDQTDKNLYGENSKKMLNINFDEGFISKKYLKIINEI